MWKRGKGTQSKETVNLGRWCRRQSVGLMFGAAGCFAAAALLPADSRAEGRFESVLPGPDDSHALTEFTVETDSMQRCTCLCVDSEGNNILTRGGDTVWIIGGIADRSECERLADRGGRCRSAQTGVRGELRECVYAYVDGIDAEEEDLSTSDEPVEDSSDSGSDESDSGSFTDDPIEESSPEPSPTPIEESTERTPPDPEID